MIDVEPKTVLAVLASYFAGSLPMGLFVGKLRGVDLRQHGSGNIGATNAGRVLGKPWFFVVFALDFLKSFGPALTVQRLWSGSWFTGTNASLAAGAAAVVGHVFPIFLKFRGGKGVATACGLFLALAPAPAAIALLAWMVSAKLSRYVSVGSLVAAVVLPLGCWMLPRLTSVKVTGSVRWTALLVGALIVVRHRGNIGRLLRGEEPRSDDPAS